MKDSDLEVEFVFAQTDRQVLKTLKVPEGSTVGDVINHSRIENEFPDIDMAGFATGIWGREVSRELRVQAGDRVEIYRPLEIEPREARRQLASMGRTMRGKARP